jgi:hypothetical protein
MECFTPWYLCSECGQQYIKLPNGAEQASWCSHLRGDGSSRGRRILGDVCFTGTGLIFGSRGGVGAYTEAYLDHFHDEIAEYHTRAHVDSTYRPTQRSTSHMALVQIEESELATLRRERDEARSKADELANANRDLTTKVETAEAAKVQAETQRDAEKARADGLEESAQKATLKDGRMSALGAGFLAMLGDTSKARLTELASTCSDEQWDAELKEREEMASRIANRTVTRSEAASNGAPPAGDTPPASGSTFKSEEVASFLNSSIARPTGAPAQDAGTSVRQLARRMSRPAAGAAK